MKPKIHFHIMFFQGEHTVSWNCYVKVGKRTDHDLILSRADPMYMVFKRAQLWEKAGAEVSASRYTKGQWISKPSWRWFKEFKELLKGK